MRDRLIIGNNEVELSDDVSFSYIYENSLFNFDDLKLSRTLSFKIKRTPAVDGLFDFAHQPERSGAFVRVVRNATILYSNGKIEGELLIKNYTDNSFECAFVYGNLLKLKELKEIDNIDFLNPPESLSLQYNIKSNEVTPNNAGNWDKVKYRRETSWLDNYSLLPSVRVEYLISMLKDYFNIEIVGIPNNKYFIKPNNPRPASVYAEFDFKGNGNSGYTLGSNAIGIVYTTINNNGHPMAVWGLKANQDVSLEFWFQNAQPTGTTHYPLTIIDGNGNYLRQTPQQQFLMWQAAIEQDREQWWYYTKIQWRFYNMNLKNGDMLFFFNTFQHNSFVQNNVNAEDFFISAGGFTLNTKAHIRNSINEPTSTLGGQQFALKDNLPKLSCYDLILTLAHIQQKRLIVRDNIIELYDMSLEDYPIDITDNLIEIKSVTRNIIGSAQRNIIEFESNDYISENNRVLKIFNITNQAISEEKTVFKHKLSETLNIDYNARSDDIVWLGENFSNYRVKTDMTAEIMQNDGGDYLKQIKYVENKTIGDMYRFSTQVVAKFFMYQFEFHNIKEKSTFLLRAKKYACSGGTWQKGVAELTLILLD